MNMIQATITVTGLPEGAGTETIKIKIDDKLNGSDADQIAKHLGGVVQSEMENIWDDVLID